ncbi:MAG: hypothetical protein AAGA83_00215 [Cyanobacteria bacterium P01_F01_bin.116]
MKIKRTKNIIVRGLALAVGISFAIFSSPVSAEFKNLFSSSGELDGDGGCDKAPDGHIYAQLNIYPTTFNAFPVWAGGQWKFQTDSGSFAVEDFVYFKSLGLFSQAQIEGRTRALSPVSIPDSVVLQNATVNVFRKLPLPPRIIQGTIDDNTIICDSDYEYIESGPKGY